MFKGLYTGQYMHNLAIQLSNYLYMSATITNLDSSLFGCLKINTRSHLSKLRQTSSRYANFIYTQTRSGLIKRSANETVKRIYEDP